MSDAQEIQTGHAGASRCSGAAIEPHSDAGDPGRSDDALRVAVDSLRLIAKEYSLHIPKWIDGTLTRDECIDIHIACGQAEDAIRNIEVVLQSRKYIKRIIDGQ